ncbi:Lytic murein transglycosylase [Burkholderiales bacterium 8X]|nr:Lytic murein transglycosylase [Burkholderiales bacterium 8X]
MPLDLPSHPLRPMRQLRLRAVTFRALASIVACAATVSILGGCAAPNPASAGLAPPPATPLEPTSASIDEGFAAWLADFRARALSEGIRETTLRSSLDRARHLPEVVERDRSQPEFTRTPWAYLDSAVSPQRVSRGLEKLGQVRPDAEAASSRYGVPPEILVAIWGMESNYGSNYGSTPTVDALATLGFDGRRADWARRELLAALRILDQGDIEPERMVGSWAGAMGQTQFLPSNFLAYAVDADGDRRRDIWGSLPDVMASTANFLARSGWKPGEAWGVEVMLPAGFDPGRADPALRQAAAQWAGEGVQGVDSQPLPSLGDAELLLPAGARGPAFLVGNNFRTLLRYNNSTSYALAVGLLSQRLAGGAEVRAAWPRDLAPLGRSQVLALQTLLNQRGFDSGMPDGLLGPATRDAVRRYQRSRGLPPDGYPTEPLLQQLR